MKKLTLQIAAIAFVAVSILFASCSKEGPAGATGPAGAAGPAGGQGPAGAKGDDGTANVIYSEWLDVTYEEVDEDEDGTTDFFLANIDAPMLDAGILSSGEIKVYFNFGTADDPYILPLPYSNLILPAFYLNTIELSAGSDFSTTTNNDGDKIGQYRYILIPGGTAARKAGLTVDWNDYNQVKKYLNLKD